MDTRDQSQTGRDPGEPGEPGADARPAPVRHTIRAATLLYSAPGLILRGPVYLVAVFLFVAIGYSFWAKKDELVAAPLILQRESVTIQAVGGGMVADVAVKQNAPVRAGDAIATVQEQIRATASPERQAMEGQLSDLEKAAADARRAYEHQLSQLDLQLKDFRRQRVDNISDLKSRIATIGTTLQSARTYRAGLSEKVGVARRRLDAKRKLFESRDITVNDFETSQLSLGDLERAAGDADADIARQTLALQDARQELAKVESLTDEERLLADIAKLTQDRDIELQRLDDRVGGLQERLAEADTLVRGVRYQGNMAHYKSSVDGTVSVLSVHRGQIITTGTPLATIVKETAALEGVAFVQNKDIGRLRHGQQVKIKYYAYPYQEYGIPTGSITDIAARPSGLPGRESMYAVTIALDSEAVRSPTNVVKSLEIGLEGIAEIKTGDKRFIELLFTPVSKFFNRGEDDAEPAADGAAGAP